MDEKEKREIHYCPGRCGNIFLFAVILEKPLQALLIAPTQIGLADTGISQFLNTRPILWAFIVGLFPGVFEETGRLVAYKTVLKKRKIEKLPFRMASDMVDLK